MTRLLRLPMYFLAWLGLLLAGPGAAGPYYAQSHAVVVGIDDYRGGGWPRLAYARRDAEAVAALLQRQGFEVKALYDAQATKTAIVSALQTRLAPRLKVDDRVLVFFAGHGHTERLGEQDFGYLVPYDGTADSATYLSMEELQTLSEKMGRAKHQLFILNACYGGLFGLRGQVLRLDPSRPGYLEQITRRAARQFITAGGSDQQVLDGGPGGLSFFSHYLLEALGEKRLGDLDGDGVITFPELAGYLVPRATNAYQTPATGALPGDGGGEFVFLGDAVAASPGEPSQVSANAPTAAPGTEVRPTSATGVSSQKAGSVPDNRLWRWLGEHLWEIFSGIGTAAVVGLLGWLGARRRKRPAKYIYPRRSGPGMITPRPSSATRGNDDTGSEAGAQDSRAMGGIGEGTGGERRGDTGAAGDVSRTVGESAGKTRQASKPDDVRRQALLQQLELLQEQQAAVLRQIALLMDAGARVQAEQQERELDRRIRDIERELGG